ncbi:MAG: FMN-binding protein [Planctomycetes bacterium]|nr:FMN-binding protein [Planctomycetota bacterium]
MIKNFIEKSWLLIVASLAFGLLLAGTNEYLDPLIKEQQAKKFSDLAGAMVEGAADFQTVSDKPIKIKSAKGKDIEVKSLKRGVDEAGNTIGWAFEAVGSGFADKIKLVIAVDAKFETIKGFGVLSSNETPGFGDKIGKKNHKFVTQFPGTPAEELTLSKIGDYGNPDVEIIAISGATVTSDAVVSIFNTYISQVKAVLKEKGLL